MDTRIGSIYIFKHVELDWIKVGYTEEDNPYVRIKSIGFADCKHPEELNDKLNYHYFTLIYWFKVFDRHCETKLHRNFCAIRTGEFYEYKHLCEIMCFILNNGGLPIDNSNFEKWRIENGGRNKPEKKISKNNSKNEANSNFNENDDDLFDETENKTVRSYTSKYDIHLNPETLDRSLLIYDDKYKFLNNCCRKDITYGTNTKNILLMYNSQFTARRIKDRMDDIIYQKTKGYPNVEILYSMKCEQDPVTLIKYNRTYVLIITGKSFK